MSYQVFARKYRPQTFQDVLGQEHVVRTLRNAISQNRLAHAYLFVGPRGTGKTSTARIFAMALNCPDGPRVDFDPNDEICKEIAEGRSLDVLEIDGASNTGVEQVRELRESVKYAPARSRFKIYYIDEVHMLSTNAFNALLKTLEEPPPHVKFIFATTEANKILPTIISRCQRFDLRRIPHTIIAKHLLHIANLEGVQLDEKAAFAIGKGAEGGMRDAQSMLDQLVAFCGDRIQESDVLSVFGFTGVETVTHLAQHILESDTVHALRLVHEQSEAGKDLSRLLTDLIQHVRTLLVSQADPEAAAEDLEPEIADQVAAQAGMASTEQLLRIVDGLADVDARMRWATNKKLHFELGVIQAVQHLNEVSISDVIEALDGGAPPPRPTPRPQAAVPRRAPAASVAAAAPAPPVQAKASPPTEPVTAPQTAPVIPVEPAAAPVQPAPAPAGRAEVPKASAETPAARIAPASAPAVAAAPVASVHEEPPTDVSADEFWSRLQVLVQERRQLVFSWLVHGVVRSIGRGVVKLAFPTTESHARDSLMRDNQRKFLEGIAEEILGTPVRFEMGLDPALKPPPVTEMHFSFGDEPSIPSKAEAAPPPEPAKSAPPAAETAPPAAAGSVVADFHDDPLIKSAIEKFKLKLSGATLKTELRTEN